MKTIVPHAKKSAATSTAKPVKLGEVVVTATRLRQPLSEIGTSVSVMPGAQMQDQKLGLVAPALQQLPGVEVNQAGSPGTADRRVDSRRHRRADAGAG